MDEKISQKLKDGSFVDKLMTLETHGEVKSLFKDEGLEISNNEIRDMGLALNDTISKLQGIPDEKLENISGGLKESVIEALKFVPLTLNEGIKAGAGYVKAGAEHVEEYSGFYTAGTMAVAAVALTSYAAVKSWKAVKSLGETRGWWKGKGKK